MTSQRPRTGRLWFSLATWCLIGTLGCVSTPVGFPPLGPGTLKLASLAESPVAIEATVEDVPGIAGHQYLLFVIPFGRVRIESPALALQRALYHSLALRNYRPHTEYREGLGERLLVTLTHARVSAYDLFFLRRVSATMRVEFTRISSSLPYPVRVVAEGSASEFRKFGFRPELQRVFEQALLDAISRGIEAVGLDHPGSLQHDR